MMQGVGATMLASFLVDLVLQAWPLALLQPAWLDQMNGLLVSRGLTPLTGALLVAAGPVVSPKSDRLANRARLLRRLATWVAIGYLLLIPVQLYAGVKLLQEQKQQARQVLEQASRSIQAIRSSTNEAELRQAYEQIPGPKAPLPETLPKPLSLVRDRLSAAIEARNNRAGYEVDQRMASLWNQAAKLVLGNILRALILAAGFAAIARRSPGHPTLLTALLRRKQKLPGQPRHQRRRPFSAWMPWPWSRGERKNKQSRGTSQGQGDGR